MDRLQLIETQWSFDHSVRYRLPPIAGNNRVKKPNSPHFRAILEFFDFVCQESGVGGL